MLSATSFVCCPSFCWLTIGTLKLFLYYAKLMANYMIIICLFHSFVLLFLHISNVYRNFAAIKIINLEVLWIMC